MERKKEIAAMLQAQCARYPRLQPQDLLKALHQSVCGCGHLVEDETGGLEFLRREAAEHRDPAGIEVLNREYCRVHLGFLEQSGLSVESLFRLFCLSARESDSSAARLEEGLEVLLALAREGAFPFPYAETAAAVEAWRGAGFPLCRHSAVFRETYQPAYRVIRWELVWKMQLMAKLDQLLRERKQVLVAIEGGAGSGKTTLARWLEQVYDCNVFHMDDYFLRPQQRTEARLAEPGGNVDRERFLEEVLLPLRRGEAGTFRRFDCGTQTLCPEVGFAPKALNLVEGAYSLHPLLAEHYDLKVFLKQSPEGQRKRILKRNTPEFAQRFFREWIPMENRYFETFGIEASCAVVVEVEE